MHPSQSRPSLTISSLEKDFQEFMFAHGRARQDMLLHTVPFMQDVQREDVWKDVQHAYGSTIRILWAAPVIMLFLHAHTPFIITAGVAFYLEGARGQDISQQPPATCHILFALECVLPEPSCNACIGHQTSAAHLPHVSQHGGMPMLTALWGTTMSSCFAVYAAHAAQELLVSFFRDQVVASPGIH